MNLSDEQKAAFEQELENTDVKAILLGIHAELVELRKAVEESESETGFVCHDCGESFDEADALINHAVNTHHAPPGMDTDFYGVTP